MTSKFKKINNLIFAAGITIVVLSILLMLAFSLYDLFATTPINNDVRAVSHYFESIKPSWRVTMLLSGLTISTLGIVLEVCRLIAENSREKTA